MNFKVRKVTRSNGEVEFRLCLSLSAEEANEIPRIADWDETHMDFHRAQGDVGQRADWVLMQARLVAYWSEILKDKDKHMPMIISGIESRNAKRKKRRNR